MNTGNNESQPDQIYNLLKEIGRPRDDKGRFTKVEKTDPKIIEARKKLPKLVRDNIPEFIVKDGFIPIYHYADKKEYLSALQNKLLEEFEELMDPNHFNNFMSGDYSELADVLDVIDALLAASAGPATHIGHPTVANKRLIKQGNKGKFDKNIILENILDRREVL